MCCHPSLPAPAMHAPLREPMPTETEHLTWRGGIHGRHYFDSSYVAELFRRINSNGGEPAAIDELLRHSEPLIRSLIKYRRADRHVAVDELLNTVRVKLWKSVRLFDPSRGSSFAFVSRIAQSVMASAISEVWHRSEHLAPFDEGTESAAVCDSLASGQAIAEIHNRVRRVKTPCTDVFELRAQKWFVESFIDSGFHLRRHEMANAVMQVFGVDHRRSRSYLT